MLVVAAMLFYGWSYIKGPFAAPDWVETRVIEGIESAVPGAEVSFENLELRLDIDGRPRVSMRNVVFSDAEGVTLLELFDLDASLSFTGLWNGGLKPKRLYLSGVVVDVTRSETGSVRLGFGQGLQVAAGEGSAAGLEGMLNRPVATALDSIEVENVTLRYDDLRAERSWTVDGGRFRLDVDADGIDLGGSLALLSGRASVATLETSARIISGASGFEFGVSFADMPASDLSTQAAALGWLGVLDAPISGSMRGSVDASGKLQPVSATLQIGEGALQPSEGTRRIPFSAARTYFTFDTEHNRLNFDEISIESDWLNSRAEGAVDMELTENGLPKTMSASLAFTQLQGLPGQVWQREVGFDRGQMDFDVNLSPFVFELKSAELEKGDQTLAMQGAVRGQSDGWALALEGHMQELSHASLIDFWPLTQIPPTRNWLEQNISGAKYTDLTLGLNSEPGGALNLTLLTDFENARIRYVKNMAPATQVSGRLEISGGRLRAEAYTGVIAPVTGRGIDGSGTVFEIPDLKELENGAVVHINGHGPFRAVAALLEEIPALAEDDTDLRDLGEGYAQMSGSLRFPINRKPRPEEFIYEISGQVRDVSSDNLLSNLNLSSDVLEVKASNAGIEVSGPAQTGDVVADVTWSTTKDQGSTVSGQVELSQAFAEEFKLGLPEGTVSGKAVGILNMSLPKDGDPEFVLTSNLEGLGLDLSFVNWRKPEEASGELRVVGKLSDPVSVDVLEIDTADFKASGTVSMLPDGGLDEVAFEQLQIGGWLDAAVRIVGRGESVAPDVVIEGGVVDLPEMSKTVSQGRSDPNSGVTTEGRLLAQLDRLVLTEALALNDMSGDFAIQGLAGSFEGSLNGRVDVLGTVANDQGKKVITLSSDDAGEVFAAIGLLDKADQGDMWVELKEAEHGYHGKFRAVNVLLRDMPALAQLFDAISIVGLLEQLAYDGILFAEVEGEFYMSEQEFILTRASATGPSTGLSLDGTYDLQHGTLDLQGVLSPAYMVNALGGLLNRKGEGLIGISFTVTGDAGNPVISVNPLSALAPGLFREIFRKAAPKAPE